MMQVQSFRHLIPTLISFQNLMKKGLLSILGNMLTSADDACVLNAIWTLMVRSLGFYGCYSYSSRYWGTNRNLYAAFSFVEFQGVACHVNRGGTRNSRHEINFVSLVEVVDYVLSCVKRLFHLLGEMNAFFVAILSIKSQKGNLAHCTSSLLLA